MHFYGFFQTENKLSKDLIKLSTFSGNKFAVILRAEIFKISIICGKKNWFHHHLEFNPSFTTIILSLMFKISCGLNFSNVNFRDM